MNKKDIFSTSIKIWIAISKNNKIQMFSKMPTRGKTCWIGDFYINSAIYENIENMIKNSSMTWNSEPEYLELAYVNPLKK